MSRKPRQPSADSIQPQAKKFPPLEKLALSPQTLSSEESKIEAFYQNPTLESANILFKTLCFGATDIESFYSLIWYAIQTLNSQNGSEFTIGQTIFSLLKERLSQGIFSKLATPENAKNSSPFKKELLSQLSLIVRQNRFNTQYRQIYRFLAELVSWANKPDQLFCYFEPDLTETTLPKTIRTAADIVAISAGNSGTADVTSRMNSTSLRTPAEISARVRKLAEKKDHPDFFQLKLSPSSPPIAQLLNSHELSLNPQAFEQSYFPQLLSALREAYSGDVVMQSLISGLLLPKQFQISPGDPNLRDQDVKKSYLLPVIFQRWLAASLFGNTAKQKIVFEQFATWSHSPLFPAERLAQVIACAGIYGDHNAFILSNRAISQDAQPLDKIVPLGFQLKQLYPAWERLAQSTGMNMVAFETFQKKLEATVLDVTKNELDKLNPPHPEPHLEPQILPSQLPAPASLKEIQLSPTIALTPHQAAIQRIASSHSLSPDSYFSPDIPAEFSTVGELRLPPPNVDVSEASQGHEVDQLKRLETLIWSLKGVAFGQLELLLIALTVDSFQDQNAPLPVNLVVVPEVALQVELKPQNGNTSHGAREDAAIEFTGTARTRADGIIVEIDPKTGTIGKVYCVVECKWGLAIENILRTLQVELACLQEPPFKSAGLVLARLTGDPQGRDLALEEEADFVILPMKNGLPTGRRRIKKSEKSPKKPVIEQIMFEDTLKNLPDKLQNIFLEITTLLLIFEKVSNTKKETMSEEDYLTELERRVELYKQVAKYFFSLLEITNSIMMNPELDQKTKMNQKINRIAMELEKIAKLIQAEDIAELLEQLEQSTRQVRNPANILHFIVGNKIWRTHQKIRSAHRSSREPYERTRLVLPHSETSPEISVAMANFLVSAVNRELKLFVLVLLLKPDTPSLRHLFQKARASYPDLTYTKFKKEFALLERFGLVIPGGPNREPSVTLSQDGYTMALAAAHILDYQLTQEPPTILIDVFGYRNTSGVTSEANQYNVRPLRTYQILFLIYTLPEITVESLVNCLAPLPTTDIVRTLKHLIHNKYVGVSDQQTLTIIDSDIQNLMMELNWANTASLSQRRDEGYQSSGLQASVRVLQNPKLSLLLQKSQDSSAYKGINKQGTTDGRSSK